MTRPLAALLVAASLAACSGQNQPPEPSGPWRPLNAGRWVPAAGDLDGPRPPPAPARSPVLPEAAP